VGTLMRSAGGRSVSAVGVQDPLAGAGHRRSGHERTDRLRMPGGDRAADAAADVVADQHRAVEPELVDQPEHARRLGIGGVGLRGRPVVAVGLSEAAQVGHHDVGVGSEQRDDIAVVGARPRPAVQQDDGRAGARAVVGETEPVDRGAVPHQAGWPASWGVPSRT